MSPLFLKNGGFVFNTWTTPCLRNISYYKVVAICTWALKKTLARTNPAHTAKNASEKQLVDIKKLKIVAAIGNMYPGFKKN